MGAIFSPFWSFNYRRMQDVKVSQKFHLNQRGVEETYSKTVEVTVPAPCMGENS